MQPVWNANVYSINPIIHLVHYYAFKKVAGFVGTSEISCYTICFALPMEGAGTLELPKSTMFQSGSVGYTHCNIRMNTVLKDTIFLVQEKDGC